MQDTHTFVNESPKTSIIFTLTLLKVSRTRVARAHELISFAFLFRRVLTIFFWRDAKKLYVRYESLRNRFDVMFVHYLLTIPAANLQL